MRMDGDESSNIEDRRDGGGGFGGGPVPRGGGGVFTGGLGVVGFIVLALLFGADPGEILGGMTGGGTTTSAPAPSSSASRPAQAPAADPETQFVARVLKSTETVWSDIFRDMGRVYREPKLVLFRDATRTDCGVGQAAMGPFYCPADQKVYLDLGFFDELAARFRAPGQFPQAYVIAHEIGHHVQNLLGISGKVQQMRQGMSKRDGNALSVRTELQADCFAGVWANRADRQRGGRMIDDRDVDQAMAAAAAIGDDNLQRQTQGRIVPDSFTHGSSAQRTRWFRIGLDSGDYRKCDTFRAQQL
ncbi:neutral zinc metallopeptidase [Reyranella sp.]|uniref:KPN_02809 family neutral zinc metallopeptidase n=1 Tax=Reyranella sp. TaxID=1929291 RepID=UPI00272FA26B|nr:neutral zinc metallopeptidase [Reyranella sp.]MDP2376886.1 neutral zinc metallopeptidase [Reyranella sp.]